MALDLEPLIPHDDDDIDEQPELIPPNNPPAPPVESPTKIVRRGIIYDIQKLLPSTQTSSPSLKGNHGFDSNTLTISGSSKVMAGLPDVTAKEISVGEPGDTVFPHEDAGKGSSCGKEELSVPAEQKDIWEYTGSVLCRLASTDKYAGFMVENHVLEMILANLEVSKSARITEICLGMLGNLASQEDIMKSIVSNEGLIKAVVDQLFLDDVGCLCEAFRLLILGLQDSECIPWVKALLSKHIIKRIVWITKNTVNEMLLEMVVGLFVIILRREQGIVSVLIPYLIGRGLPELLVSLLAEETSKLYGDLTLERRRPVLDVILLAIEALSVMEDHSHRISFTKELIELICDLVKYPNKTELHEARVTAAVLLANALADDPRLAIDMSQDFHLFRGMFNISALTPKDKDAVWNVLSHLLVHIKERKMGTSTLLQYVSVLTNKSDLIEDILLDRPPGPPSEHPSASTSQSSSAVVTALSRIISILKQWTRSNVDGKLSDAEEEYNANDKAVRYLVECCERHLKDLTG